MGNVIVQVSKAMTRAIDRTIRPAGMRAEYIELSPRDYALRVDCMNDNRHDARPERGTVAAIRITYPASYYAMPQYLTTRELIRLYKEAERWNVDFFEHVAAAVAV